MQKVTKKSRQIQMLRWICQACAHEQFVNWSFSFVELLRWRLCFVLSWDNERRCIFRLLLLFKQVEIDSAKNEALENSLKRAVQDSFISFKSPAVDRRVLNYFLIYFLPWCKKVTKKSRQIQMLRWICQACAHEQFVNWVFLLFELLR